MLVFRENWPTIRVWMASQTQWQWVGGFGVALRTGLNYQGVQIVADSMGIGFRRVFADLQIMEAAALDEWSKIERERADKERRR